MQRLLRQEHSRRRRMKKTLINLLIHMKIITMDFHIRQFTTVKCSTSGMYSRKEISRWSSYSVQHERVRTIHHLVPRNACISQKCLEEALDKCGQLNN